MSAPVDFVVSVVFVGTKGVVGVEEGFGGLVVMFSIEGEESIGMDGVELVIRQTVGRERGSLPRLRRSFGGSLSRLPEVVKGWLLYRKVRMRWENTI